MKPPHLKPMLSMPGYGKVIDDVFPLGATCIEPFVLTHLASLVFSLYLNIAVPVDFAIVGKLAQTVFPGSECGPFKPCFLMPGYGEVIAMSFL
jgi:hypothetical protein